MILLTLIIYFSISTYMLVRFFRKYVLLKPKDQTKTKIDKIPSKKILISIPEQTELKCPIVGDKLTKDNTHTCSCGTSYSKDVVYSRYITKCEYCKKVFKIELIEYTPQSNEKLNFGECYLLVQKAVDLNIIKTNSTSGVYRMNDDILGMTFNRTVAVVNCDITIQQYIQNEISLRESI